MSPAAQRLLDEALALPEDARTDLVEALLESLDGPTEPPADVEAAWASEIDRRLRELEAGSAVPVPWEDAREAIFGPRRGNEPRR